MVARGYRNIIALTMLLLASIGALIAGWSAIKQQSSTALGRRVAQAQMLELSDRVRLVQEGQAAARWQRRLEAHLGEARRRHDMADRLRSSDLVHAHLLDLESSEAFLLAGASRPFLAALPHIMPDPVSIDERLVGLSAATALHRQGVKASWTEPVEDASSSPDGRPATNSGVAGRLEYGEKIRQEEIDGQVVSLSRTVVGFVLALVLLTFADLFSGRRRISLTQYGAGLVVAIGSLALALTIDIALLPLVGSIAVAFVVFLAVSCGLGWLATPAEADPAQTQSIDAQGFAGGALQGLGRSDGFSRALIVGIAVSALVSAIIGYWYALANSRAEDAAQSAYEQELEVVKRASRATTAVLGTFDELVELYEARIRCQSARNRSAMALDNRIALPRSVADADAAQRCVDPETLEKATRHGLSLAELDKAYGRQADRRFPLRLQQHVIAATSAADASEALSMWDGYNERATYWNAKATTLLACLTIVAIALYIFGQSLAMAQVRATRAMAACAALLTAAAIGWSGLAWSTPEALGEDPGKTCRQMPDADGSLAVSSPDHLLKVAAINFSAGQVQVRAALEEREFQDAVRHFECALKARPHFAMAHAELGEARAISQSAHRSNAYYSLPSKERLGAMLESARSTLAIAAIQGVEQNAYALNTYAVALWAKGIHDGDMALVREARTVVEKAIAWAEPLEQNRMQVSKDPARSYYPWLSIVPLLHLNRSLFLIADGRIDDARTAAEVALSLGVGRDWGLQATMVTAAALLEKHCEKLQPADQCAASRAGAKYLRQALVTGAWNHEPTAGPADSLPATHRFAATVSPSRVSWAALPTGLDLDRDKLAVLWSVANEQWNVFDALPQLKPAISLNLVQRGQQGQLLMSENALAASDFKRCLAPGRYRAELYRNGRQMAVTEVDLRGPELQASSIEELNLALCRPSQWKPWHHDVDQARGASMAGFTSSDGRPAAFLFAIPLPETSDSAATAAQNAYAVERALETLRALKLVDGTLEAAKERLTGCTSPPAHGLIRAVAKGPGGIAYVAIVFADSLDPAHACDIVGSITMMHSMFR